MQRDDRFPRSHVALHQPIHGPGRNHVAKYFSDHLILSGGQLERQSSSELLEQWSPRIEVKTFFLALNGPVPGCEGDLQEKQLLKRQPPVRRRSALVEQRQIRTGSRK